jgi:WD40 repeat protein
MGDVLLTSAAGSADGRIGLFGATDRTLRVWAVTTAGVQENGRIKGHEDDVLCVALSQNGLRGLSGGGGHFRKAPSQDHAVYLWDIPNRSLLRRLEGHKASVLSVAFSPLGDVAMSGSADRTVRLWRLP